jgi:predicted ferric reductase
MLVAVIWIASILLRKNIGFRPWKYIHYFAYISIPFALLHVPDLGTQFIAHPIVKAYYLLLAITFSIFFLIRLSAWLNFDRQRYEVVDHQQLTDLDYALTLRPLDTPLMPEKGQYIYIKQGIVSEDHPFSATYCDPKNGDLTIVYRTYGAFTQFLTSLPLGEIVQVGGPYGQFTQDKPTDKKIVYIAGGVGVTPFAQHILDGKTNENQWLFVSNKTRLGAPLVPQIRRALGTRLVEFYTRDSSETDGTINGRIEVSTMREKLGDLANCSFYICGPPMMVEDMKQSLLAAAVPANQVNIEEFSW